MIARGFKSVIWVGAVGSAALGCYMVSLRVATERADLAHVERQIVDAKRDIRSLQTELGTRGRLAQLEDWNSNVLALSAPTSNQFVKDGFALARLQTRVVYEILPASIPGLRLSEQFISFHPNIAFRGPRALWVEWDTTT